MKDDDKSGLSRREFVRVTGGTTLGVLTVGPALAGLSEAEADCRKMDFIVVGTGSGGGILINRLVRAGFKVLALEAGVDMPTPKVRREEATQFTIDEKMTKDFRYLGEPEVSDYDPNLRTPLIDQSMGKMVGGSSHHFGMVCYRASPEDFDEWDHFLRDGAGALSGTLHFNGTTLVTGTGTHFQAQLKVGDYIRLDSDGQPFRVASITSATVLHIDNPQGLDIPSGNGAGTRLTPWNRSSMLVHYKAVEHDIDLGTSDPVNHSATGDTEIGRIGGFAPGDFGETRPNVGIPRIQPVLLAAMESLTGGGDGTFEFVDDINNWDYLANQTDNFHKIPLAYVGRNSKGKLVAGGHQVNSYAFLEKYDERRSTLIVAIDPIRHNSNLQLEPEAFVNRVLFTQTNQGLKAVGVEYLKKDGGNWKVKQAFSDNIILCAGAYSTPAILMRSGVGPQDRLQPFGITQLLDLPGVGSNMLQHIGATLTYRMKQELPLMFQGLAYGGRFRSAQNRAGLGFEVGVPPILFDTAPEIVYFISVGQAELANAKLNVFQYGLTAKRTLRDTFRKLVRVQVNNYKARSRGEGVFLNSRDPRDLPTIFQGIFQNRNAKDAEAILDGMVAVNNALLTGPFGQQVDLAPTIPTLAQLHAVIGASYHGSGTTGMGPASDPLAVCDERARVRGIKGLRICDTGLFPTHTRANPHLTVTAAADLIASMIIADGGA